MDADKATHSSLTDRVTSTIPDGQEDPGQHHPDTHYDEDIYRGGFQVPEERAVDEVSTSSASISSSTSASAHLVRRALATIVELAILRWARSSSPNDSDSSLSSIQNGASRPQHHPHQPRISTTAADTAHIAISRKAAEQARRVTRQFHLVLPVFQPQDRFESLYRILQTSSHTLALAQLALTLRQAHRARKDAIPRDLRSPIQLSTLQSPLSNIADLEAAIGTSGLQASMGKSRPHTRPKHTQAILRPSIGIAPWQAGKSVVWKKAWWLDVASPTWDDMRAIGTLLHLHPLTLEDILHQDPREKLEFFPSLGYYFIVFRAIDARSFTANNSGPEGVGELTATNVYLVVFREGICSFHFSDISDHLNRVRGRITQQGAAAESLSSDLIAHGLLDSMVDAFIPLIDSIEIEVENVDALVTGMNPDSEKGHTSASIDLKPTPSGRWFWRLRKMWTSRKASPSDKELGDKESAESSPAPLAGDRLRSNPFTVSRWCQRVPSKLKATMQLVRFLGRRRRKPSSLMHTLLKMSHTRRRVVHLARLLAHKSEIIGHLRKRLAAGELSTHLGDVQDHILTMQHSLAYYERVLSYAHPAYLSSLNVFQSQAKAGSVQAVLWLTCVSVGVLCLQLPCGVFSMNVHIPGNRRHSLPGEPIGTFHWFGAVMCIEAVITFVFIWAVWRWTSIAKKKFAKGH